MCGIFGYIGNKKTAGDMILDGLKSLEYRGYDSWGVVVKQKNNNLHIEKHVGKIGEATLPPLTASAGIGHTRWATHGGVTKENSHPHLDCTGEIVVVHNGIIENYAELKQKLHNKHTYLSETDSEVFAHIIEEKISNGEELTKAVLDAFTQTKGLSAIIVYHPKTDEFVAIKNGSPLVFATKNNEFFLASDSTALISHTNKVYFLEDNELLTISRNGYQVYDLTYSPKTISFVTLAISSTDVNLGEHPHFMMKEIHEQPFIIRKIVQEQELNIQKAADIIQKAYGTYFLGCGTAYYAGLAGTYLFSKIAKKHVNASVGSEFAYHKDFLQDESLVIALSQSGETIDIISSIKEAKEKNAKIMAITNVLGSTLYRMSDHKLLLTAGPEKGVLATKSFTAKITYLYLLAHTLNKSIDNARENIGKAADEVERLLTKKASIHTLAKEIKHNRHIYILGRGVSYPTALESALKIKEVSYIHAEGFAAGELKHGVIALIEKDTPVIVFNPEDETYEDTLNAAHEVKARGAHIIGISSKKHAVYDTYIPVRNCEDATIIPHVVVAQLLGYYLAIELGNDPDKPRNLAKSVTVK